jgi:nucleotide-binding universal stress UspA family protein
MIKTILVPTDGSTHADAAVDWAADLAAKFNASLSLLHVLQENRISAYPEEIRAFARYEKIVVSDLEVAQMLAHRLLDLAAGRARSRGATAVDTLVTEGNAAKIIVAEANRLNADLIVMGRRGLGSLSEVVLGGVSSKVLHLADCACLTVK